MIIGTDIAPGGLRLALSDRGSGAPVFFGHGLCGDARQPAEVFPLDAYRCLTLESRGHGDSEPGDPADFSIAVFADDAIRCLDRLALGPIAVGGISMGAAIALRIAVTRPDLVSALILARPAWVTAAAPGSMRPNAVVGELLARFPAIEARARFDESETAHALAQKAPANLATLRGFFDRPPQRLTAALLVRIAADGPGVTREQLGRLRIPALVVGSERDAIHPLAFARELTALIARARLAVVPPKADGIERHRLAFRAELRTFLMELSQ